MPPKKRGGAGGRHRKAKEKNDTVAPQRRQRQLYDEKGRLVMDGRDVCDCLIEDCPGCHFPCPKCKSPKCGAVCRVNRKTYCSEVEVEGTDTKRYFPGPAPKTVQK